MRKKGIKYIACLITAFMLCTSIHPLTISAAQKQFTGIDVSKNNGSIDWGTVKAQGMDFVMIKTGNGRDTGSPETDIDSQFEQNYEGAGAVGLKRGVYHMISGRTPAAAILEAKYCLSILNDRELEYPIAYDIETTNPDPSTNLFSTGKENVTAMAKAFCDTIEAAGYKAMIYTSSSILNNYLDYDTIRNYKIWIAHHDVESPSYSNPYQIWQFTEKGSVEGANNHLGFCDMNYAYEKLTLSKTKLTLGKGEAYRLSATLDTPAADDSVKWTTSNKKRATVSSLGTVRTLTTGTNTITAASSSNTKAKCIITIKKAPTFVRFVSGSKKIQTKSIKKGASSKLNIALSPGSASNKLTYKSNNSKVVTVSTAGKIKGLKTGSAVITVKTYNGKTAKLKVTVK